MSGTNDVEYVLILILILIYFTFHWSYRDVELVLYAFSIINKGLLPTELCAVKLLWIITQTLPLLLGAHGTWWDTYLLCSALQSSVIPRNKFTDKIRSSALPTSVMCLWKLLGNSATSRWLLGILKVQWFF
jgi:hypothetical protein